MGCACVKVSEAKPRAQRLAGPLEEVKLVKSNHFDIIFGRDSGHLHVVSDESEGVPQPPSAKQYADARSKYYLNSGCVVKTLEWPEYGSQVKLTWTFAFKVANLTAAVQWIPFAWSGNIGFFIRIDAQGNRTLEIGNMLWYPGGFRRYAVLPLPKMGEWHVVDVQVWQASGRLEAIYLDGAKVQPGPDAPIIGPGREANIGFAGSPCSSCFYEFDPHVIYHDMHELRTGFYVSELPHILEWWWIILLGGAAALVFIPLALFLKRKAEKGEGAT